MGFMSGLRCHRSWAGDSSMRMAVGELVFKCMAPRSGRAGWGTCTKCLALSGPGGHAVASGRHPRPVDVMILMIF